MMLAQAMAEKDGAPSAALEAPTAHRIDLGDHLVFMSFQPQPFGAVVAFEGADPGVDRTEARRAALGEERILKAGFNAILVLPKSRAFFRTPDLRAFFDGLVENGALDAFRPLIGVGTGMGAFGALSFARRLRFTDVLAAAPVSTLSARRSPASHRAARADRRMRTALRQDWEGPLSDGAAEAAEAARVSLLYDPFEPGQAEAVRRVRAARAAAGRETAIQRAPGLGPEMGSALAALGLWDPLLTAFLAGRATPPRFGARLRARRRLGAYYEGLAGQSRVAHSTRLSGVVERARAAASEEGALIGLEDPHPMGRRRRLGIERPAR